MIVLIEVNFSSYKKWRKLGKEKKARDESNIILVLNIHAAGWVNEGSSYPYVAFW